MELRYSDHAIKRMKERGIEHWEVEHILKYPEYTKKSQSGKTSAVGELKNRKLKVIFIREESYINVVSVMIL